MGTRTSITGVVVALTAVLLALRQTIWAGDQTPTLSPWTAVGRNNTVLLLFGSEHGLSNVHVATALSLQQHHPEIELHVASFERSKARVRRISSSAAAGARPVKFHVLHGPDYADAIKDHGFYMATAIQPPRSKGIATLCKHIQMFLDPWPAEVHYDLYQQLRSIIRDVDPAVVVLDAVMRPATEATRDEARPHAILSPNTISDVLAAEQPMGQVFWKYPAMASGFSFPVPWRDIPENIYLVARFLYSIIVMPEMAEKRRILHQKGIQNPLDIVGLRRPDVPYLSQEMEGAALPVSALPPNVTRTGPITVSVEPVEQADPELAAWLARGPTLLVNLGSTVRFAEDQVRKPPGRTRSDISHASSSLANHRLSSLSPSTSTKARVMAHALAIALERVPGLQVIWKFRKSELEEGHRQYTDDVFTTPLQPFLDQDRIRLPKWLAVDPTALLESGHVVASVHHGGANVYHEAIATGIPHVVLPLWVDLYNYAALVEDIGVGVWASRKTAPDWTVEDLSAAILKVVSEDDPEGAAIRAKAKILGDKAKERPGRDYAADLIAAMAAHGR